MALHSGGVSRRITTLEVNDSSNGSDDRVDVLCIVVDAVRLASDPALSQPDNLDHAHSKIDSNL